MSNLVPIERIENKIYLIRGQKVMLDSDLAALYQVPTSRLNEQVKRNLDRFPGDFMFRLTEKEFYALMSQNAISKRGGRRKMPYVFAEQGVAMLSSVLKSKRAVQVNIAMMRAFVKLRKILATHKDLAQKLSKLEDKFEKRFKKNEAQIQLVFDAIRKLIEVKNKPKKKIGFLR